MHLTLHTDYALRMLMLLAVDGGEQRTIANIAQRYHISRHHLVKVTQTLVRAGFLRGQRGRGGGLQLARPPAEINLGAVVRATEEGFALVECFGADAGACVIGPACGLKSPLAEATRAFLATLDRYSLADLVAQPRRATQMRKLLALSI